MKGIARVLVLAVEVYFVLDYFEAKRKQAFLKGYVQATKDVVEVIRETESYYKKA